jgi:hypothetical protein
MAPLLSIALAAMVLAGQTAPPPKKTVELTEVLFVLNPLTKGAEGGADVLWIPQPLQKYCLGKTAQQCSTIDYCIRTTNRDVSMCQNLGVDLARLPLYPPDTRPRRLLSVTYFPLAPIKGFDTLRKFLASKPAATFDRLSLGGRIKGRIKFTRSPDDDDFDLLEVLAVPPF